MGLSGLKETFNARNTADHYDYDGMEPKEAECVVYEDQGFSEKADDERLEQKKLGIINLALNLETRGTCCYDGGEEFGKTRWKNRVSALTK